MRANMHLHVTIHIEEPEAPSLDTLSEEAAKHKESARRVMLGLPVQFHVAASREVISREDTNSLAAQLQNHINRALENLSFEEPRPVKSPVDKPLAG